MIASSPERSKTSMFCRASTPRLVHHPGVHVERAATLLPDGDIDVGAIASYDPGGGAIRVRKNTVPMTQPLNTQGVPRLPERLDPRSNARFRVRAGRREMRGVSASRSSIFMSLRMPKFRASAEKTGALGQAEHANNPAQAAAVGKKPLKTNPTQDVISGNEPGGDAVRAERGRLPPEDRSARRRGRRPRRRSS